MELFEPKNFFPMADLLANILTGAVATSGLLIACLTYKVAAKALLEWKNQKNLEYLERFLKVFYRSKNYIYHLRNPLAMDTEILEKHKSNFYKDGKIDQELFSFYFAELLILSRRESYIPMLEELLEIKSLAKIYLNEESVLTDYINLIIELDKKIINAAQSISIWDKYLKDPYTNKQDEGYIRALKKVLDNKKIVYGLAEDEIYKGLDNTFKKCEKYLSTLLNNYKKI